MILRAGRAERALTGLELVILAGVVIGIVVVLWVLMAGSTPAQPVRSFPGGVVAESMYVSGDSIQPVGSVTGFSATWQGQSKTPVVYRHPDPARLGSVQLTISLFMGDTGAIDTDRLNVTWTTKDTSEQIGKTRALPLICPNWTIARKFNMLPGRTADSDEWLEPGEQFLILVCPSQSLTPYQAFSLGMYPDGVAIPLRLTRSVPPRIQPVMNLG